MKEGKKKKNKARGFVEFYPAGFFL